MTEKQLKTNLLNIDVWIRLAFMVLFALLIVVARIIILVIAALQFLLVLITAKDNTNLRNLGQGISKWVYQGLLFLTFNTDAKPFPFDDWPDIDETEPYVAPQRKKETNNPSEMAVSEGMEAAVAKSDDSDSNVPSFTSDTEALDENDGDDSEDTDKHNQ